MDKKNVITAIAATLTGSAIGAGAALFITNKKSEKKTKGVKKVAKPHKTTKVAVNKVESKNTTSSSTTQK